MAVNNLTVARCLAAPSCLPSVVVPHRDGQSHRLQLSLSAVMREYVCPAVRQRAR